ncbi:aspartyl protease family protein [Winogradskyella wandonensis]|nr:aspartyl protease family protein [Winogradskyella wandonensis]
MPVELNGIKLSFVLDTGVSRPILFNLANLDSLQIKNTEQSYLRGLGRNGNVQAIRSRGNIIKVGEAIAVNRDISMVFDPSINFTARLGVPVHGIIGYDIFKDFIVEINYQSKYIRLHKRRFFKPKASKKWKRVSIELINRKPYVKGFVSYEDQKIPVKLLIDTGGGDSLWLFEGSKSEIKVSDSLYFEDFLGKGLSGPVYGLRSKLPFFELSTFGFKNVNVAYPDSLYLSTARTIKGRNGSVAGNILKRFNVFFDYSNNALWLKKNGNFKLPFYYNNSGIVLEQRGVRMVKQRQKQVATDSYGREVEGNLGIDFSDTYKYVLKPSYEVVELRKDSNADLAGVKLGDIILSINKKDVSELTLQQVNEYFYNKKGFLLRLLVERGGKTRLIKFKLDDVFKKKSPQIEGSN